jgi:peptide deformylase
MNVTPLPILTIGDPRLEERAHEVTSWDTTLTGQLAALHATLDDFRRRRGFGRAMAAPQVGIRRRVIVMNLGAGPVSLINPSVTWRSADEFAVWDDCLSIPDRVVRVKRNCSVSLTYEDEHGRRCNWLRLPPDLAELMQHEIDHLDGILMTRRAWGPDAVRPIEEHAQLVGAGRPKPRLSLERIAAAARCITPVFRSSPQYECESLSAILGCRLTLKVETVNPIRSFKGRGADFFLQQVAARGEARPLVCGSAGNWGQALAWAARAQDRSLVVYAATSASPLKVDRMRSFGAEVRLEGADFDAAKEAARRYAADTGSWMVEDGLEPEISEGAGSIGVELLRDGARLDAILVPLGNGALLNGIARWVKAASPATRVIGVCAAGAPAMQESFIQGEPVVHDSVNTIADGIGVRVPIPEAVVDMRGIVDEVRLVSDEHIIHAMRLLYRQAGLLVEPAGAAGLAVLLDSGGEFRDARVATVLCGGNLTDDQVRRWVLG